MNFKWMNEFQVNDYILERTLIQGANVNILKGPLEVTLWRHAYLAILERIADKVNGLATIKNRTNQLRREEARNHSLTIMISMNYNHSIIPYVSFHLLNSFIWAWKEGLKKEGGMAISTKNSAWISSKRPLTAHSHDCFRIKRLMSSKRERERWR